MIRNKDYKRIAKMFDNDRIGCLQDVIKQIPSKELAARINKSEEFIEQVLADTTLMDIKSLLKLSEITGLHFYLLVSFAANLGLEMPNIQKNIE